MKETRMRCVGSVLLVSVSLLACSGNDSADSSNAVDASQQGLAAPELTELVKMGGALHVNWKNHQLGCDSIEGERKTDTTPYIVVFHALGIEDNKMDRTAKENTTYTYRLRCQKGDQYSPYSNEKSRNPTL